MLVQFEVEIPKIDIDRYHLTEAIILMQAEERCRTEMTPMGMVFGQEQYAGTMQQSYGIGARIIAHHSVTWDDVRDFMLSDDGLGDTKANKSFEWIIEEFKKGNYEIPQKVLSEIINKKNES